MSPINMSSTSNKQQQQQQQQMAVEERHDDNEEEPATIVIAGAGIVGLVLALALQKHTPSIIGSGQVEVYERAPAFHDNVGAGMGLYPNGLRVLRDIDPALLQAVRHAGRLYEIRSWERHDGSQLMTAQEDVLLCCASGKEEEDNDEHDNDELLSSIGIRRWQLQKVLYDAAVKAGIPIYFGKTITDVISSNNKNTNNDDDGQQQQLTTLVFSDGTTRSTKILFGADGGKSIVRQVVLAAETNNGNNMSSDANTNDDPVVPSSSLSSSSKLEYTGVTCLMGLAECCPKKGISFPSSTDTKCHACFFPTTATEQCFQFHFPVPHQDADPGNWGTLSQTVGTEECRNLAERLREEGWDEQYLQPLRQVTRAVRIGFCLLQPRLDKWVYGRIGGGGGATRNNNNKQQQQQQHQARIVLVGDAAHPPVPYTGQGAQMGMEDAGTIALLLKHLCLDEDDNFILSNFGTAMRIYEKLRIPRTSEILDLSKNLGKRQQKRADNPKFDKVQEELIQREVFFHKTLPAMLPGATYDYKEAVEKVLEEHHASSLPFVLEEEEEETEELSEEDGDDSTDVNLEDEPIIST